MAKRRTKVIRSYQSPNGRTFILWNNQMAEVSPLPYKDFFLQAVSATNQPLLVSAILDLRTEPKQVETYLEQLNSIGQKSSKKRK